MTHQWRFFRSGGFDQVRLDRIEDWQHLDQLDPKLWAALSCPVKGLEFDSRTLHYLDADHDGRVRIDDVKAAVRWALGHLKHPEVLLTGAELPLAAIDSHTAQGQTLLSSAKRILVNLGKADAHSLSCDDTADLAKVFPADQLNGDGVITVELANTLGDAAPAVGRLIQTVIDCGAYTTDRSGALGINQAQLDTFIEQATAHQAWHQQASVAAKALGAVTEELYQLVHSVDSKVTDYFTRCQLAAYDTTATPALNAAAEDFSALSRQLLTTSSSDANHLPLARVSSTATLPLRKGVHPHWAETLSCIADLAAGLWGDKDNITPADWHQLKSALQPYAEWKAAEPQGAVAQLAPSLIDECLQSSTLEAARALIASDLSQQAEAESVLDVDKLVRYQAHLRDLLRNFVNLENFYSPEKPAIFQNGRLYIDGRSCELCLEVMDAAKHGKLAGLSGMYLLYLDCVRAATGEKKSIVAAMTAGDAGNLMVGRNGVYYDAQGHDWDANVSKLVENPISIREAFFTPYQRIGRMISEQIQKFAASKDKEIEAKSATGVGDAAKVAESGAKPAAPFDAAKFAGIFAAIGLALGAIGTAIATMVSSFLALTWWQMPLALAGILLFVSGPSMLLAWFKLRTRNLAPLLDANGWAVNTNAKLSISFGSKLTAMASIPAGASRSLIDPYEHKSTVRWYFVLALIAGAALWLWQSGLLKKWLG